MLVVDVLSDSEPDPIRAALDRASAATLAIADQETRANLSAQDFALAIVDTVEYKKLVWLRLKNGTLPAMVEVELLRQARGKPIDQQVVTFPEGIPLNLNTMSDQELVDRAEQLTRTIYAGVRSVTSKATT